MSALLRVRRLCADVLKGLRESDGNKEKEDAALRLHYAAISETWRDGWPYKTIKCINKEMEEKTSKFLAFNWQWQKANPVGKGSEEGSSEEEYLEEDDTVENDPDSTA